MTPDQIRKLWGSGFVNRWHTNEDPRLRNSQDTTAAHAGRVALLVALLNPTASTPEVLAALVHDAPEVYTGDLSHGTKDAFPEIRDMLTLLDARWWTQFDMVALPAWETPLVKLCDQIDAVLFCSVHAPDLMARDTWQAHVKMVLDMAEAIHLRAEVFGIFKASGITMSSEMEVRK